jgi:23S rRNA A1618 N6-methylase RlmF
MKFALGSCDDNFIEYIKNLLGDGSNSPNWNKLDTIEIGIGQNCNLNYTLCVYQGNQNWLISKLSEQKSDNFYM